MILAKTTKDNKPLITIDNFLAGAVAGSTQIMTGQPLDIVKVRLQTSGGKAIEIVKSIFKKQGIKGFYKGTLLPLLGQSLCLASQFTGFNLIKRLIAKYKYENNESKLNTFDLMLAGFGSSIFYSFIMSPMELGRIKMQVKNKDTKNGPVYKSSIDAIRQIYKTQGIRGLYFGHSATLSRESFGGAIYFGIYESLIKYSLPQYNNTRKEIPKWKICMFGGTAGYFLWTLTFPLDIIKSRMQSSCFLKTRYRKIIKTGQIILKEKGVKGFFKGLFPAQVRAIISNGLGFLAYELTYEHLSSLKRI
jgi:solute carrier family 25 carnitine/acylcarnitine transporter 20/29